jgi:hypothetical protein
MLGSKTISEITPVCPKFSSCRGRQIRPHSLKKKLCANKRRAQVCVCVFVCAHDRVFVRVRVCVHQSLSLFGKNHPFSWCSIEPVHSNTNQKQKFQYVHNSGKMICVYRALVRVALL